MDAKETLETRHAVIEDLFHEIAGAKDAEMKRLIFEDVAAEVGCHAAFVRSHLRTFFEVSVHRPRIDSLLADLRAQDVGAPAFDSTLVLLQEELECEMDEIESRVIPKRRARRGAPGASDRPTVVAAAA